MTYLSSSKWKAHVTKWPLNLTFKVFLLTHNVWRGQVLTYKYSECACIFQQSNMVQSWYPIRLRYLIGVFFFFRASNTQIPMEIPPIAWSKHTSKLNHTLAELWFTWYEALLQQVQDDWYLLAPVSEDSRLHCSAKQISWTDSWSLALKFVLFQCKQRRSYYPPCM